MNKQELIAKISQDTGITKTSAAAAVDSFFEGITKSLKKPANPSTIIARRGSSIPVKTKMQADAPTKPATATRRRARATLANFFASRGISQAATRHPAPPRKSGRPDNKALIVTVVPRALRR